MTDERREAKADKKAAKALRPWFKKKRFIVPLAVGAIVVAAQAGSGGGEGNRKAPGRDTVAQAGGSEDQGTSNPESKAPKLFAGRADAQKEDQERNIGEGAKLSGYTATVTAAGFQQSVSDFEKKGYVVVDVNILNRDSRTQSYNPFHWKLQTPKGQVTDPGITSVETLHSGDLIAGGTVSGKIVFEVGPEG